MKLTLLIIQAVYFIRRLCFCVPDVMKDTCEIFDDGFVDGEFLRNFSLVGNLSKGTFFTVNQYSSIKHPKCVYAIKQPRYLSKDSEGFDVIIEKVKRSAEADFLIDDVHQNLWEKYLNNFFKINFFSTFRKIYEKIFTAEISMRFFEYYREITNTGFEKKRLLMEMLKENPFIPRCYGHFIEVTGDTRTECLFMEVVQGKNLDQLEKLIFHFKLIILE